ncbi:MAG: 3-dehydroquinate synthase [Clostridiales bacterium GWB2_37_7]|nr:MAG: 3-dehydroquinate synthase [Clostridiales bacterium GWB2_37_7]
MKVINARLNHVNYDIFIHKGLLATLGEQLSTWYKGEFVAVITDSTVDQLYGSAIETSLKGVGYRINRITIPPGEQSKSLISLNYVYSKLAELAVDRSSLIIAFGGGVVGDLAGFAAATYMRGVPYVQVPTTLMSQLDSSIGGKTAINLKAGKNLAGGFYHPRAVYTDPLLLDSLPQKIYCDGLAEAIKYGAIKDSSLFDLMLRSENLASIDSNIEDILYSCCSIKTLFVQKDEFDRGERQLLNFGHTIGHGIERYFDYQKVTHGEAVGLGMLQITRCSEAMNLTSKGSYDAIEAVLKLCQLPTVIPSMDKTKLLEIISHDKKSKEGYLNLILLRNIGNAYIHQIAKTNLDSFII